MQQDNKTISMTAQELLDKGLHCYSKKDLEGALFFLEPLFLLEKNNVDLINTIINILQEIKSYIKAQSYINVLLELDADNDSFQFLQAENLFFQGSYVRAVPLYLQLHSFHPLNTHILQRLLAIYSKQNKRSEIKQIRELLAQAEAATSDAQAEIEATVEVALSLVERGESDQAKILLESVLLFDEKNINANGIYGALLSDEGEYEKALYYLDKIAFLASQEYILVYLKCLKEVRGYPSTIEYLNKRIVKYSSEDATKKILATYYYNNKEYKEAYEVARSISHKYPEDLSFTRLSAMSNFMSINEDSQWMNIDKLNSAAKQLHNIYKYFPEDENILIELIKFYLNIGEIKKAYYLTCNGSFESEKIKSWNKFPYYFAVGNKNDFFNSYICGREVRSLLVDYSKVVMKVWNGESLAGKKVLILREQGIGDEILFASNYNWIIEQSKKVDIFCSPRLKKEFTRIYSSASFHSVIEENGQIYIPKDKENIISKADVIVLAGDLPALHYKKNKFPLFKENYFLISDAKKKEWENNFSNKVTNNKPRVGIVWRGGNINSSRSAQFLNEKEVVEIVNALPEVEFFSCMYADCKKELNYIKSKTHREINEFEFLDQKDDFENTAAMLSCLDLLVGAFIAPTSLAVAVGTPTIIFYADYLIENEIIEKESIYYPSATHISLPILDIKARKLALSLIVKNIRTRLNLGL